MRVYAGIDPASRRRRYLTETVPAGPRAFEEAETVRSRLLEAVRKPSVPQVRAPASVPVRSSAASDDTTTASSVTPMASGFPDTPHRGGRRGRPTLSMIASLADVSAPTVSKVLNGRSGVAAETRFRIEALLRDHGYRRPELGTPSATVEVVFYGMQSNLAVAILQGVEQVVGEQRLAVGFTDARRQVSQGRFWSRDLLARRPTGVIAVHLGFTSEQHALLGASGIPLVVLDPTGEPPLSMVPSVTSTNWSGGFEAARHLLDLGHRRIAIIAGPTDRLCARARLDGARAALEAAGTRLDPQLLRTGQWFSFDEGLNLGQELLRSTPAPTAVLCGNDLQALGVYEAARLAGRRIPQDLSVVGFDDIPYTRLCGPQMTSVAQPLTEMGAAAAEMVLTMAANRSLPQARIELATTLMVRDSTAAPPTR
ncbi:LacI family DNA-binding transcriptional regulator [Micromonospora sp. NPDC050187]|uniref:LacI family DNA-binding transcriptional regulator n=1 Tax=Micromonospora sp. NPDC050187 TaxID=3364277 RepID=UPI00378DA696